MCCVVVGNKFCFHNRGTTGTLKPGDTALKVENREGRARSVSDSNIKLGGVASGLSKSPRVLNPKEFDLIMEYSKKFSETIESGQGKLLMELSQKMLDASCAEKATEFARVAFDLFEGKVEKEEAAKLMQRAELTVRKGDKVREWEKREKRR